MRILITGGTGLIGSNLIPKLKPNDITKAHRTKSLGANRKACSTDKSQQSASCAID